VATESDFEFALRSLEKAGHEIKIDQYGFALSWTTAIESKFHGVEREAFRRVRPQCQQALEQLSCAYVKATGSGKPEVAFWLKRTEFGIPWLDIGIEAVVLGKMLDGALKTSTPLIVEQRQNVLAATGQLLSNSRALIEITVSDAKPRGDFAKLFP
jgi:hypothetical protein